MTLHVCNTYVEFGKKMDDNCFHFQWKEKAQSLQSNLFQTSGLQRDQIPFPTQKDKIEKTLTEDIFFSISPQICKHEYQ